MFLLKPTLISTFSKSHPFLSAYIRRVMAVQAAKEDSRSSVGVNPKFPPPNASGSSAVTIWFPAWSSVLYFCFPMVAMLVFIFFQLWLLFWLKFVLALKFFAHDTLPL